MGKGGRGKRKHFGRSQTSDQIIILFRKSNIIHGDMKMAGYFHKQRHVHALGERIE